VCSRSFCIHIRVRATRLTPVVLFYTTTSVEIWSAYTDVRNTPMPFVHVTISCGGLKREAGRATLNPEPGKSTAQRLWRLGQRIQTSKTNISQCNITWESLAHAVHGRIPRPQIPTRSVYEEISTGLKPALPNASENAFLLSRIM
jgi:hypothetical protein